MSLVESYNPYESPRAGLALLPATDFSVGTVLERSWAAFQARMGLSLGIIAVGVAVGIGLFLLQTAGMAMFVATRPGQGAVAAAQFLGMIAVGLANFTVNIGQTLAFLRIARGEPATIGDVFAGGPFLAKLVLATVVLGLVSMIGLAAGAIPGAILMARSGMQDLTAIGVLVLGVIVASLILSVWWIRVSQYMYVGVDEPGLGPMATIRRSMELTRGHFWGISAVYLLVILVNFAGSLLLGIGLLFTIPLSIVMIAMTYATLAATKKGTRKLAMDDLA